MPLKLNSTGGGSVTLDVGSTASNYTLTLPSTNGSLATTTGTTFADITDSGNLTFTGTGNRITGDFSNATWSSKVLFQSSTSNGQTAVGAIPNGTSTQTQFIGFNGTDPSNSAYIQIAITATEGRLQTGFLGTGSGLPMTFYTNGGERMRLDTSGNLGLGVTPSAWGTTNSLRAIEMAGGSLWGYSTTAMSINQNAYLDGTNYIYKTNAAATRYTQLTGTHLWYTAPSGTAGSAISFTQAMTLDQSGNLGIGASSPNAQLHLLKASGTSEVRVQSSSSFGYMSLDSSGNYIGTGTAIPTIFTTNNTERMRIDSSGNVGIGTSSPTDRLNLANTVAGSGTVGLGIRDTTNNLGLGLYRTGASYSYAGVGALETWLYSQGSSNLSLGPDGAGAVKIVTNGFERMRIDSAGTLCIGRTVGQGGGVAQTGVLIGGNSAGTPGLIESIKPTGTAVSFYVTNGGQVGTITTTSSATSYNTSSDYRLKENIQPMQNALDVVAQLNPVRYTWKADGSDGQGFIAHELQAVVPDCVTGEKDAVDADGNPVYQGIDTSFLSATLTKAIQELKAELDELKAKVNA